MPAPETISDHGHFHEGLKSGRKSGLLVGGRMREAFVVRRKDTMHDHGHGADLFKYKRASLIFEHGHFTDVFSPKPKIHMIMADVGIVSSTLTPLRHFIIVTTLHGTSTFKPHRQFTMGEHGHLTGVLTPKCHLKMLIADDGELGEKYTSGRASIIRDHGKFVQTKTIVRHFTLHEEGVFEETYGVRGKRISLIKEHGKFVDVATNKLHAKMFIADVVDCDDLVFVPGKNTAYTAPTDNFGMSRYTDLLVNSLAEVNGVVVGAGAAGVYAFDGKDDAGSPINSSITTSVWEQGKGTLKRPGYMYCGLQLFAAAGQDMRLGVVHFRDGAPATEFVSPEPHPQGGYISIRFKMPRAIRSYYFQYILQSVGGARFTLDDMHSMSDALGRSV